jgi:hypothetical protein
LYFAHGQIDRLGGCRGCHFALFDPGNRGCVAWNVVEMAWQSPLWGACGPFPAIKSRMCEYKRSGMKDRRRHDWRTNEGGNA